MAFALPSPHFQVWRAAVAPRARHTSSREEAERELKTARAVGIEYFMLAEPDYPSRLQMIGDPPPVVALRGKLEVLKQTLIAIVGSRNASAAGVKFAERMARDLGEKQALPPVGDGPRNRRRGAPRQPFNRNCCRARRRSQPHLTRRTHRTVGQNSGEWRRNIGDAVHTRAARSPFFPAAIA